MPDGVTVDSLDPSGCVLRGAPSPGVPGVYGLLVVVRDDSGASVDVPIAYLAGTCDTAAVTLTPDSSTVMTQPRGGARTWTITATDVSGVSMDSLCLPCASLSILTRGPLSLAPNLDCAQSGDRSSEDQATFSRMWMPHALPRPITCVMPKRAP